MNPSEEGLEIGSIAPPITAIDEKTDTEFSLHSALENHRGLLLNFIRGNF
jgi:hypothetical protein